MRQLCNSHYPWFNRLLNANKINCLRVGAFQDLHNLNLLSLYDNKLQTIAKGTFAPLRAIQTLWVFVMLWWWGLYVWEIWLMEDGFVLNNPSSLLHSWSKKDARSFANNMLNHSHSLLKGIWLRTHLSVIAIWSGWRIICIQTLLRPVVPAAPAPVDWQTKGLGRSKARNSAAQVICLVQLLSLAKKQLS